jgi:hypothetical protein
MTDIRKNITAMASTTDEIVDSIWSINTRPYRSKSKADNEDHTLQLLLLTKHKKESTVF